MWDVDNCFTKMAVCYLGIGANLGKREDTIRLAISEIGRLPRTRVLKVSSLMETDPHGGPPGQPRFLNGALKIFTGLPPLTLLKRLHGIESGLGRIRSVHHGPRTIDIDILMYDYRVIRSKSLNIPHPALFERRFVLQPLAEVL